MPTLDQIARDFQYGRFTFQDISSALFWVAAGAACLAGIGLVIDWWQKRQERAQKAFTITDPERIHAILHEAVLSRSRLDVRFEDGGVRASMACALAETTPESVRLEVPWGVHPSPTWIGRTLAVYFHLPPKSGPAQYYFFHAPVVAVHPSDDISHVELAAPVTLEMGQKRRHFRLELPSADLLDLRLWLPDSPGLPTEADPNAWPAPLLTFPHIGIVDISAGGLRLSVDPQRLPRPQADGRRVSLDTVRLCITLRGETAPETYFFEARLRNQFKDYATSRLLCGYQFQQAAIRTDMHPLAWSPVDPERGVSELGDWIFRRHMELYRQHAQLADR